MGFHEDGTQAGKEAGLQVAQARQPGGEQGMIVIVIVVALPETLMLQYLAQWYVPTDFGGAAHSVHERAGCPQDGKVVHGAYDYSGTSPVMSTTNSIAS